MTVQYIPYTYATRTGYGYEVVIDGNKVGHVYKLTWRVWVAKNNDLTATFTGPSRRKAAEQLIA